MKTIELQYMDMVSLDNTSNAVHPYEVHFMPATGDGYHQDDDRYKEYTADTSVDVLRCILENWLSLH